MSTLFRTEAMRPPTDRLHGTVSMVTPPSWKAVCGLLVLVTAAAGTALATGGYSRVELARGSIVASQGIVPVTAPRAGLIVQIIKAEGDSVLAGEAIARIASDEYLASGASAPQVSQRALSDQDAALLAQGLMTARASEADRGRLQAQRRGAMAEVARIDAQIRDQARLVAVAAAALGDAQGTAAEGFMSRRDLEARETTLIERRQQLDQLHQQRTAKLTLASESDRSASQAAAAAQAQLASIGSSRAALRRQAGDAELAGGYLIRAPVDGIITALTARVGQTAQPQQALAVVVPRNARLEAQLRVPVSAIGFVRPGQEVRLSLDAFPFERFGTVSARLRSVAGAPTSEQNAAANDATYVATATLRAPYVVAFGERRPLLPGMTFQARVVTERRSLIQWLFEPLFAIRRR